LVARIIEILSVFIVGTISTLGYGGIVLLMAIESACIPLPSEVIMPFSGYLVYTGRFNLGHVLGISTTGIGYMTYTGWFNLCAVGVAGAVGCVLGSLVAYWVGSKGGRPLIEKYGRYILFSMHDLDLADRWFARYGEIIVFGSRLLPVVRTFIAFPAGVARMNLTRFTVYTFIGSLPWCIGLAYVGQLLGEQWDKNETLKSWFHRFDFVIGIIILLAAAWWVWRHIKHSRTQGTEEHKAVRTQGE
jgi:membrane protein DedA with SNARE-associated domain